MDEIEKKLMQSLFFHGEWHWCTNRHFDKNIAGFLFFHYFYLKIWLSWHLAQQGKVQVVIKLKNWKEYEAGLIQRGSISF